jgi:hypothetical protein
MYSKSEAMGDRMNVGRCLGGILCSVAMVLALTACSAETVSVKRDAVPFSGSPTPAVSTAQIVGIVDATADSLDSSAQASIDCKSTAAADTAGVAGSDPVLRAQIDPCWAQIDSFLAEAVLLGANLRTVLDESSTPDEITDITEETANLFQGAQYIRLSPECRIGSEPDFDTCATLFRSIFAVIQTWSDRLSPAWRVYT